ncbi:FYVE, RhoGEF and PH domain-containing protein 6-like isoform X3 [Halichondria panicea]|uniref:FYVE, RhoGEF and PH domain-containing protein 6-like isoform X3 n=1 Tax=Halichondria panicea TaxID=6063 RepID=UPI00312B8B1C
MEQGIHTEAQLAAAIEAGEWYDSDSETENDNSEAELSGEASSEEVDWTNYFWNTGDKLDTNAPLSRTLDAHAILKQLSQLGTDYVDYGGQEGTVNEGDENGKKNSEEDEATCRSAESAAVVPTDGVTDSTTPHSQSERPKHYSIAHEIMTTERTYVQSVRLLEKVVHGAIKTSQMTGRAILPEQGRKEIFLNIGEIYALNFDLLQELEDRLKNWDSNSMIADVLAKRAPFFKLYSMYSARFDSAQAAYCKWLKTSKPFAELIKLIETGPLCKGLPVSSYMLCPVQRIPRYKLLLEDYLKHLPEDHPDIDNTKAALAAIAEAAEHMNERITDMENQVKVVQMQKTFVGKENIVAPGRKYIGRGPVFFVPGSRWKQRVLFLFSDVLLVARITAAGRYRIRHKVPLKKMLVSIVESPVLRNGFCIAERGLTKPFRFCTKSVEERTKWITELSNAKTKDEGVLATMGKNSPYAAVLNDPEAHSSIMAVLNDPSFEHNHPSWVRRSLRYAPTTVRKGLPFTSYALASQQLSRETGGGENGGVEEVDFGEGVVTEFVCERKYTKVLRPGLDHSLSSYMHYQCEGKLMEVRWFVLTCRTLVCYQDHTVRRAFTCSWYMYPVMCPAFQSARCGQWCPHSNWLYSVHCHTGRSAGEKIHVQTVP